MKTKELSIKELAAYIGVSTDTVRRTARRKEIAFTFATRLCPIITQKGCAVEWKSWTDARGLTQN